MVPGEYGIVPLFRLRMNLQLLLRPKQRLLRLEFSAKDPEAVIKSI